MGSVAARMIDTDTSPSSSLALCNPKHGGCGWRSPIYRTREKAKAAGAAHRAEAHPELVTELASAARTRQDVAA
jgi:hypothetical protein